MTEKAQSEASNRELVCPKCQSSLPADRRSFPWCECGWNLPPDPMEEWHGWKRLWGRINRRLGKLQAERDAIWLGHENAQHRLGWQFLTTLVFLLGPLSMLIQIGLLLLLAGCLAIAINALESNCITSLILFSFVAWVLLIWRPDRFLRRLRRRSRRSLNIEQESVLETLVGVAQRLEVNPPTAIAFTPLPYMGISLAFQWTFPPRLERIFVVGLPVLAVMNVTEFKAVAGHILATLDGTRVWFLPAAGRVLRWCWGVMQMLLAGAQIVIMLGAMLVAPFLICFLLAVVVRGNAEIPQYVTGKLGGWAIQIAVLLLAVAVIFGGVLWLAALWYRRNTLMADRKVATAYGKNVFSRALPKLWVAQRSFGRQWGPMLGGGKWGEEELNLYAQFRDRWLNLPAAFKEKAYREVTVGFRTLLYFEPVFEDRMILLVNVPDKLFDDRPAAQLLPFITDLGADITRDFLGE